MSESLAAAKQKLRQQMLEKLRLLSDGEKGEAAKKVFDALSKHPAFIHARVLMIYSALPTEISLGGFFEWAQKSKKIIALPRVENKMLKPYQVSNMETDLTTGLYRVLEPRSGCREIEVDRLELVIVPGLAYDRLGWRLGRGKGFYDRFMSSLPESCATIGVCFKMQLLESVSHGENDVRVKEILAV